MLRSMLFLWVLMVLFGYNREANRMMRGFFGVMVILWGIRIVFAFGVKLLPLILIAVLLSHIVIPFIRGFASSFR